MKRTSLFLIILFIIASLQISACSAEPETIEEDGPVKVVHLDGAEPTRITLTADAAKRLDIQTAPVRETQVKGAKRTVIPYAAILYDVKGNTWVYTNPETLTYLRSPVVVDYIDGDNAILSSGPSIGSTVVIVGGQELFGSESEFEEE